MPTIAVNINLSSIGTDAGPFTISDNVSGVLATGIPRTSLLANYVVNADTTATQITVASTGVCGSTLTIPIDFHPCGDAPPPPPPTPPTPPPPPPEDCKEDVVINVTDTGYIKYYNCTTAATEYQFISSLGNVTLTNCINTVTLLPGFPLADIANFTVVSTGVACGGPPTPPTPPTPTPAPSYYQVELRMNGMYDMNGSLTLYESPDNSTWTQVVELETVGYEVAIQNYYLTVGYYYYYDVTKTLGSFAYANAYNTVLVSDFSPGPIEDSYCGGNTVTFPSFQLPDPYQSRSYISFNGALDSGCL
jgi:hypothetical protein